MFKTYLVCLVGLVLGNDISADLPLATITQKAYFDVMIDDEPVGRIVFGLYGDEVPKTVNNFAALCQGGHGKGKKTGSNLSYVDTIFHRVIPGFMAQGGDFQYHNGHGGESIYGGSFKDENFNIKFDKPFLLAMANSGPNTNGSQFFVTYAETHWLDGKHVVFGEALGASKDVLKLIEKYGQSSGSTSKKITVYKSGLFAPGDQTETEAEKK